MSEQVQIPRPYVTQDAVPYWQGVKEGRLLFQRCQGCGAAIWQPRFVCPSCLHPELVWEESAGQGSIYSFSTIYRPPGPAWQGKVPYSVGIVHLDEDYYFFTELVCSPAQLAVGARVSLFFDRVDDELTLPKFRLAGG